METKTLAQQIAEEIQARYTKNPRAFMADASRRAKIQQDKLDAARVSRLRAGIVLVDD